MAEKKTVSLNVVNLKGEEVSKLNVKASVFGIEPNNQVMFDAVQTYLSNSRQATAKTKVRHEVSGGGKKPWRQKGTGHARAGSSRSPIWVGGGTVFGPDGKQNYKLSQNKSAHALALKSALSQKVKDGLIVVDEINVEAKTKALSQTLKALNINKRVLVVVDANNENLNKSSKNIKNVKVVCTNNVSVYDLLNSNNVLMTANAVKKLEEVLD